MWYQHNTPSPNRVQSFTIKEFTGGLTNRSTYPSMNQALDILNMEFADEHAMRKRAGTSRVNDIEMHAPVTHIGTFRPYTDTDMEVVCDGITLRIGEEEVELPKADVGKLMDAVNHMGAYFFTYGRNLYAYTKAQAEGTYVKLTGEDDGEYHVFRIISAPMTYTPLDTEHDQGVRVYNMNAGTIQYQPCQLELEDPYKGANVVPKNSSFITQHKNRLFVSGNVKDDDNVSISDALNPYYFPAALPIQIPPNSDKVNGLAVYDDAVLVSRTHDLFAITGDTNNPELGFERFKLRKLNVHIGFMNNRVAHSAHNYLFYLGADKNVYALSSVRQADRTLVTNLLNKHLDFKREPFTLTDEELNNACGVFHEDMYYLSVGSDVLLYSYQHQAWTRYNNLNITSFTLSGMKLHMGDADGHVKAFDNSTYMDKGEPFLARWTSTWIDMGDAPSYKHFKEFMLLGQAFNDTVSTVRVSFEIDYANVNHTYDVENKMSRWGVSAFGDRFITRNISESFPLHIGMRGRVIRFTLESGFEKKKVLADTGDLLREIEMRNNELFYLQDMDEWHVYRNHRFEQIEPAKLNEPMSVLQVSGDFEFRTKR